MTETQQRRMLAAGRSGWTYWIGDENCKDRDDRRRMGFWETPLDSKDFIQKIKYEFPNSNSHIFHKGIL